MTTSPTKSKQKISLRKRLFVRKSPKVGCYVDTDCSDGLLQPTSRSISPADPFLAHSSLQNSPNNSNDQKNHCEYTLFNNDDSQFIDSGHESKIEDDNDQCCNKTFFNRSHPKSLGDGTPHAQLVSPIHSPNINGQSTPLTHKKCDQIPRATIKFPKSPNNPKKLFEHSGSFDAVKSKGGFFVKRLSADHLITTDKPSYRSSSPESDRSNSLDRKNR